MIQAITSLYGQQFERAEYFACDRENLRAFLNKRNIIGVQIVSDRQKMYNPVYANIVTDSNNTVLQTKCKYDYKVSQIIRYRGSFYEIRQVTPLQTARTPQNMRLVRQINWDYVLELVGITFDEL